MSSLTRSPHSTGPVVILVGFTVIFAAAWERDAPQSRSRLADSARRASRVSADHSAPAPATPIPSSPDAESPRTAEHDSGLLTGLRSISIVCETPGRFAVGGTVGAQLGSQTLVAERKRFCFTGGAAFLCGTMEDEEASRTASVDNAEDWSLE